MSEDTKTIVDNKLKELGKDYGWLLTLISKYSSEKNRRAEALKKYYLKNKQKLKDYHKKYRATHPEYRQKAKERSKRARGKK